MPMERIPNLRDSLAPSVAYVVLDLKDQFMANSIPHSLTQTLCLRRLML